MSDAFDRSPPRGVRLVVTCLSLGLGLFGVAVARTAASQHTTCGGVSVPQALVSEGRPLKLNGGGLREATICSVDVYVAAFYAQTKSKDAAFHLSKDERKTVVLHFVRDVSREDLVDEMSAGFERNAPGASAAQKRKLFSWLRDLREGEQLRFAYVPGKGLSVSVAKQFKGAIRGMEFASAVLSLLIGPEPPNAGLKAGLLGAGC